MDLSIEQIAKWINPKLNGWINYYGRYTCSELYSVFRYINKALVRWGRKKYKMLSRYKTRASKFLEEMAKRRSTVVCPLASEDERRTCLMGAV